MEGLGYAGTRRGLTSHAMRALLIVLGAWLGGATAPGSAATPSNSFVSAAPQGFGDRQNTFPWSMQWFKGRLYVGTNRAYRCTEAVAFHKAFPNFFPYPPADADVACSADAADLPLQAEIWRWTPQADAWERVYQSPNDVPIPGRAGKFVARDVGFRGMTVFREPDGTEALYVAGVTARYLYNDVPPPRILRSIDGSAFQPLPQAPGTVLGNLSQNGFRGPTSHNGRLYIMAGPIQGSGILLEAGDPTAGNNAFRDVGPPDMLISAIQSYNGYLYLGVRDPVKGYSVLKTDATGPLPYIFTEVVEAGAGVGEQPNIEVLHMLAFDNRLYVGGNGIRIAAGVAPGPAELIRINSDDSWDVVAGKPRQTKAGPKQPISGLGAGFDNPYNQHMWRMAVFEKQLYVGTYDSSTSLKDTNPPQDVQDRMGADLFRSADGITFEPLTTTGFGDRFNIGIRALQATPHGLFLGTANYYYGLQIWKLPVEYRAFTPMVGAAR